MLPPGTRVLVALSGGPDSVGLLAALVALRRKLRIELVAAHVNHRLRGADSDADEQCAATAAARAEVQFVRAVLPENLRTSANLEARARALRYRSLHALATVTECTRIATGHTRDDQAESVLLRLIRGTGVGGLAAIEPVRADGVVRPLLDCSRHEIEAFGRAAGFTYCIDASNRDERFLRARVRHALLPLLASFNPAIVDNLVRIASLSAAERTIVQSWSAEQLRRLRDGGGLDLEGLRRLPAETHRHLVRAWLMEVGIPPSGLTARHVDAITRLALGAAPSGTIKLRNGVIARRYDRLERVVEPSRFPVAAHALNPGAIAEMPGGWRIAVDPIVPPRKGMRIRVDLWSAVCDATTLSEALVVRTPRVGERVRPLGLAGRHRKLSDLFVDRKIPAGERRTYPVVSYGEEILWVPGVIRSELLCVGTQTRAVLRLHARRDN